MRRLYFLVPDVDTAKKIVDELLLARVEERHMHLLAKEGVSLKDLPEANLLQKSDFIPAVERGMSVGGVVGMLAGLAVLTFPPSGLILGGGGVLGIALAGAGMGAWVSGMIGLDVNNSSIQQFEKAIEAGELLLMVDIPKARVDEISEMIHSHHPNAEVEGTEPTIPAFP